MRFFYLILVISSLQLFGTVEYSDLVFSKTHKLYVIDFKNMEDSVKFLPPSKITQSYSEKFEFDYELCRHILQLRHKTLENRLRYVSSLSEVEATQYAESLLGEKGIATLKKLILDIRIEMQEIDLYIKNLNLYKEKYIIPAKSRLRLVYRRN